MGQQVYANLIYLLLLLGAMMSACSDENSALEEAADEIENLDEVVITVGSVEEVFGDRLSLENPFNYEDQAIPDYINEDNTDGNEIENEIATLGRVLFYDKNLSVDNTVACASCHQQSLAFGDDDQVSDGVAGVTGRHSIRLVNARFSEEEHFFWDERAETLEEQTTMPIQDHIEMGFSGQDGDPDINDLVTKLEEIGYMGELFTYAFGDSEITEERMQLAMAQFVRSIQSFDSRYDVGRAEADDDEDFATFSDLENRGKAIFMGRGGCDRCHQPPEFSINDNSRNNGVITVFGDPDAVDTEVTRAPTLRDIFNADGVLNGQMMHDGSFTSLDQVLEHYADVTEDPLNDNLDDRLSDRRRDLEFTDNDMAAMVAFVKTLSGENVYTDPRWSDPFEQ